MYPTRTPRCQTILFREVLVLCFRSWYCVPIDNGSKQVTSAPSTSGPRCPSSCSSLLRWPIVPRTPKPWRQTSTSGGFPGEKGECSNIRHGGRLRAVMLSNRPLIGERLESGALVKHEVAVSTVNVPFSHSNVFSCLTEFASGHRRRFSAVDP